MQTCFSPRTNCFCFHLNILFALNLIFTLKRMKRHSEFSDWMEWTDDFIHSHRKFFVAEKPNGRKSDWLKCDDDSIRQTPSLTVEWDCVSECVWIPLKVMTYFLVARTFLCDIFGRCHNSQLSRIYCCKLWVRSDSSSRNVLSFITYEIIGARATPNYAPKRLQ